MRTNVLPLVPFLAMLPLVGLLTGCAMTETASPSSSATTTSLHIQGMVHGGQQPVVGAHVYLYQAAATNYGGPEILPCPSTAVNPTCNSGTSSNASISTLTLVPGQTTIDTNGNYYTTTAADGSFSLTGDYTCNTNRQLYVYAVGGYQGNIANTNNAASFLAVLGACPANGAAGLASSYVYMNEVTTVVAAYALAGFASDATHISSGSSSLAAQGLNNAFLASAALINPATGGPYTALTGYNANTKNGYGRLNFAFVNMMANILAACINSTGSTANGSNCGNLFAYTPYSNGVLPTETVSAMINIAHTPGQQVANLEALAGTGPFLPQLSGSSLPADLTFAVQYPGLVSNASTSNGEAVGADGTTKLAIDAQGSIWTTNYADNSISQLTPFGAPFVSGVNSYTNATIAIPSGIAIDPNGNAWVLGDASDNLVEFASGGAPLGVFGSTANGGLQAPISISIDGSGNVWAANAYGNGGGSNAVNSISKFNNSGVAQSPATTGYTGGGINTPNALAINGVGQVWIANGNNSLSVFANAGTAITTTPYTGGGLNNPQYLAIDSGNNVWVANGSGGSISEFTSAGAAVSSTSGYTGGGLNTPVGIAVDGAGNVWVANSLGGAFGMGGEISEFQGSTTANTTYALGVAISPSQGYSPGYFVSPNSVEIDGSGNVWVANYSSNSTSGLDAALTELVGAATPRITPLSAAINAGALGTRP